MIRTGPAVQNHNDGVRRVAECFAVKKCSRDLDPGEGWVILNGGRHEWPGLSGSRQAVATKAAEMVVTSRLIFRREGTQWLYRAVLARRAIHDERYR